MSPPPEQPGWKKQQRADQCKHGADGNADEPQREGHQPDKRKKDKSQQGDRPAEDEKDAPTDKKYQRLHVFNLFLPPEKSMRIN